MKFFKWICVILTFCMGALFAQTIEESTFLYHGSSFGSDFGGACIILCKRSFNQSSSYVLQRV